MMFRRRAGSIFRQQDVSEKGPVIRPSNFSWKLDQVNLKTDSGANSWLLLVMQWLCLARIASSSSLEWQFGKLSSNWDRNAGSITPETLINLRLTGIAFLSAVNFPKKCTVDVHFGSMCLEMTPLSLTLETEKPKPWVFKLVNTLKSIFHLD